MLARRHLPDRFLQFNERFGAPSGRHQFVAELVGRGGPPGTALLESDPLRRWRGPFVHQWNTSTRAYEYPWVYHQLLNVGAQRVLEIGGALSGMQFVLARDGREVHNVDPFLDYGSGQYDVDPSREHAALNRAFRTDVTLHRSTLTEASLEGRFDAAICVSTIEHLEADQIVKTLEAVRRLLVPGGLVVVTVDLFLNIAPFTEVETNRWGRNVAISWLQELLGADLVEGTPEELYGFKEFSPTDVLAELERYLMGSDYPQLAQLASFRLAR
jgi:SAM-dependent methyltransferase